MTIYVIAQILAGMIQNTIVVKSSQDLAPFKVGYDKVLRVDNLSPQPGIGWTCTLCDGSDFVAPVAQ